jgi:acyl carrier protein
MNERIRAVLGEHVHLAVDVATLADNDDLFQAGLTSHASVSLMLALEEEFDLEFPDELLRRDSFESIAAIARSISSISDGQAA